MKFGNIEFLESGCNLSTVMDGRGGIFTWLPEEPIVEFNLLYFRPGKVRGNHFHPEFIEYFLVVEGSGVLVTKNPEGGPDLVTHVSKGTCFKTPMNTAHAFHAITEVTAVSMLSKQWDKCERPIVHEDLVPFDEQYQQYAKEQGFKHSIQEKKK
jgi:mannose-6-phosphate isomerase-like protein (cupin superfamily)